MPVLPASRPCVVCGVPRGSAEAPTCGSPWCLQAYASQLAASPGRRTCSVCRRVLGPSHPGDLCGDEGCRRARDFRRAAERGRRIDADFEARLARHEAGLRRLMGGRLPPDAPRVLLDHCAPPQAPLPRSRRFAFLSHLWSVVERHEQEPSGPDPDAAGVWPESYLEILDPSLAPVAAAACAACGGHCCREAGGDRAFVNREVLRRYLEARPGAGPGDFVEEYLGRLPPLAGEKSCVYHTSRGCALPVEMRSLTCNQFCCGNLREIFDLCRRRGPDFVLLAIRTERWKILDGVLLSARGYEVLSPQRH